MTLNISDIPVEICKKSIKNMHLYVKPPNGKVTVSAPLSMSDAAIERFVWTNVNWIKRQIDKLDNQPRQSEREYVSGETLYIWGRQYYLQVEYGNKGNDFKISGDKVILTVRKESSAAQRENYVNEILREKLKAEIEKRLPVWEQKTGLRCVHWQTKYMKTNWGSFSETTQTITFNLQLAKKKFECLDYIIIHELGHIKFHRHNEDFIKYMDVHCPYWRDIRKSLNDSILDYLG